MSERVQVWRAEYGRLLNAYFNAVVRWERCEITSQAVAEVRAKLDAHVFSALSGPTSNTSPVGVGDVAGDRQGSDDSGDASILTGFGRILVVCPVCGNKRCPRAKSDSNACTGSNEPGQPGSDYAGIDRAQTSAMDNTKRTATADERAKAEAKSVRTPAHDTEAVREPDGWTVKVPSADGGLRIKGVYYLNRRTAVDVAVRDHGWIVPVYFGTPAAAPSPEPTVREMLADIETRGPSWALTAQELRTWLANRPGGVTADEDRRTLAEVLAAQTVPCYCKPGVYTPSADCPRHMRAAAPSPDPSDIALQVAYEAGRAAAPEPDAAALLEQLEKYSAALKRDVADERVRHHSTLRLSLHTFDGIIELLDMSAARLRTPTHRADMEDTNG